MENEKHFSQLQLFLEELCSDLCRFEQASRHLAPKDICIDREFDLGTPEAYAALVWHFGSWQLRELREAGRLQPRDILPPGAYRGVVIVMADLCSFSSYVRDTPDADIIRENLTAFYFGDCMNVAARLMSLAGPNEIVISNSLHQQLGSEEQAVFLETEPVEARNVGRIKAWKLASSCGTEGSSER